MNDIKKNPIYLSGVSAMEKHLGSTLAHQQIEQFSKISPLLCESLVMTFYLFYGHANRISVDEKTQELCVISILTSTGNIPELKTHMEAALRCGASRREVIDAIVLTIPYSGFPRVLTIIQAYPEFFSIE